MHGYDTSGNFVSKIPCAYNRALFMTLNLLKISKNNIYFPFPLRNVSRNNNDRALIKSLTTLMLMMVVMIMSGDSNLNRTSFFSTCFMFLFKFNGGVYNTVFLQFFFNTLL